MSPLWDIWSDLDDLRLTPEFGQTFDLTWTICVSYFTLKFDRHLIWHASPYALRGPEKAISAASRTKKASAAAAGAAPKKAKTGPEAGRAAPKKAKTGPEAGETAPKKAKIGPEAGGTAPKKAKTASEANATAASMVAAGAERDQDVAVCNSVGGAPKKKEPTTKKQKAHPVTGEGRGGGNAPTAAAAAGGGLGNGDEVIASTTAAVGGGWSTAPTNAPAAAPSRKRTKVSDIDLVEVQAKVRRVYEGREEENLVIAATDLSPKRGKFHHFLILEKCAKGLLKQRGGGR